MVRWSGGPLVQGRVAVMCERAALLSVPAASPSPSDTRAVWSPQVHFVTPVSKVMETTFLGMYDNALETEAVSSLPMFRPTATGKVSRIPRSGDTRVPGHGPRTGFLVCGARGIGPSQRSPLDPCWTYPSRTSEPGSLRTSWSATKHSDSHTRNSHRQCV